jgi:hypothetical protein
MRSWSTTNAWNFWATRCSAIIFSELLYRRYPGEKEGGLTNLRSALVRRETLARLAISWAWATIYCWGTVRRKAAGAAARRRLCATFEAMVGALYLDQGIDLCREVLLRLFRGGAGQTRSNPGAQGCQEPAAGTGAGETQSHATLPADRQQRARPRQALRDDRADQRQALRHRRGAQQTGSIATRRLDGALPPRRAASSTINTIPSLAFSMAI